MKIPQYECEKCGHKWIPRKQQRPRVCPSCRSAWWDIPKEEKDDRQASD